MRVLLVCGPFLEGIGAQTVQNRRLARSLVQTGCEVAVLSLDERAQATLLTKQVAHNLKVTVVNPENMIRHPIRFLATHNVPIMSTIAAELRHNFVFPFSNKLSDLVEHRMVDFRPAIVMYVATPHFIPLIGAQIEASADARNIAFFSDPWPYDKLPYPYNRYAIPMVASYTTKMIRDVFERYSKIVYTTDAAIEFMFKNYPVLREHATKVVTVPHLVGDMVAPPPKPILDRVRSSVVHVGDLAKERFTPAIHDVMRKLIEKNGLGFTFIGRVCKRLERFVQSGEFGDHVSLVGPLPEDQAKYASAVALVNLIIEADIRESPFVPSKLAEISSVSNRWVFVTGSAGARRRELPTNGGRTVGHNPSDIAEAIATFVRRGPVENEPSQELIRSLAAERNCRLACAMIS